jgi:hypothetical protein
VSTDFFIFFWGVFAPYFSGVSAALSFSVGAVAVAWIRSMRLSMCAPGGRAAEFAQGSDIRLHFFLASHL